MHGTHYKLLGKRGGTLRVQEVFFVVSFFFFWIFPTCIKLRIVRGKAATEKPREKQRRQSRDLYHQTETVRTAATPADDVFLARHTILLNRAGIRDEALRTSAWEAMRTVIPCKVYLERTPGARVARRILLKTSKLQFYKFMVRHHENFPKSSVNCSPIALSLVHKMTFGDARNPKSSSLNSFYWITRTYMNTRSGVWNLLVIFVPRTDLGTFAALLSRTSRVTFNWC